jgi:hypothetical protein
MHFKQLILDLYFARVTASLTRTTLPDEHVAPSFHCTFAAAPHSRQQPVAYSA